LGWRKLEPIFFESLKARLLSLVKYKDEETGCWIGANSNDLHYSTVRVGGKTYKTHRLMYEQFVGDIPEGLFIDHLCKNRRCINPEHMEPVTNRENVLRGKIGARTCCPKGHPYSEENTGFRGAARHRYCKTCTREQNRSKKKRLKEKSSISNDPV